MTVSPFPPPRRRPRAALHSMCAGLLLAGGLACGADAPPSPDADWPSGALLSARTRELRALLTQLEELRDTPLARSARRLRAALPDCEVVEAVAERPADWIDRLHCVRPSSPLRGLHAHRGDGAVALALPLAGAATPRVLLRADREPQGVRLDIVWPSPAAELAALLPGSAWPGPDVLDDRERLLHARVRVAGALDLAALVPAGSQADALLHLRADVLGATVLDGTWEVAIYPPLAGAEMPRVAVALGVRHQAAAAAAAERLLDDVERHWSVSRTPLASERYTGACLLELRLLPELAPCYAATPRALVFAWNPTSLRRALARDGHVPAAHGVREDAAGQLAIDLTQLRRADLQLARRVGPGAVASVARWPWQRLVATGSRRDGALAVQVALESSPPEPAR